MSVITRENRKIGNTSYQQKNKSILLQFFLRLLWIPGWIVKRRISQANRTISKSEYDSELHLYAEIFPRGYLHYGYFSDPEIAPDTISFRDLEIAQHVYARKLISHVQDHDNPVLDVGCGMGGLTSLLLENDHLVFPLTPDRHQAEYVRRLDSGLTVIESDFESFEPNDRCPGEFGTIITSESLQYLNLEQSLPKIRRLLKPGGRWIVCDYFRLHEEDKTSGHLWTEFCERLSDHGLAIRHQEDITSHILPTLGFASFLADRMLLPIYHYTQGKLRSKQPVLHYLAEGGFDALDKKMERGLTTIDPARFSARKKYVLMVIEPTHNPVTRSQSPDMSVG